MDGLPEVLLQHSGMEMIMFLVVNQAAPSVTVNGNRVLEN